MKKRKYLTIRLISPIKDPISDVMRMIVLIGTGMIKLKDLMREQKCLLECILFNERVKMFTRMYIVCHNNVNFLIQLKALFSILNTFPKNLFRKL